MACTNCGAPSTPGAAFCAKCGANLLMPHFQVPVIIPRTSGMAIAGFVLSFFCGVLGLIFSCIGYSECKKSDGMVTGEGLAIAGIVISIVSLLLSVMMFAGASSAVHSHY